MSRRACGKVNAGVFFKLGLQAQQEQLRQEHQAHVPMPSGPGAVFVVIQSEFRFVFLKTAFNGPARATDAHQFAHRGRLRSVAQGIFDLSLIHISEPTRQAEISYAVFCLKKKKIKKKKIKIKKKEIL